MYQRIPVIYNVEMILANTEYSQELPAWVKSFSINCRTPYEMRFAFETGKVALSTNPYATIPAVSALIQNHLLGPSSKPITVYFACSTAGKTAEIIAWS